MSPDLLPEVNPEVLIILGPTLLVAEQRHDELLLGGGQHDLDLLVLLGAGRAPAHHRGLVHEGGSVSWLTQLCRQVPETYEETD